MTPYELEFRDTDDPNVVLADASGELDLTNAREFEDRLGEAANSKLLVLDLNGVSFVDSAALHALFRLSRRLTDRFGVVLDPNSPIARTFDIVGLDEATRVRASAEDLLGDLNV